MSNLIFDLLDNISEDQKRLMLSILISFPLGFLNHFIKGEKIRLIYGLVFGFIIQFYLYGISSLNTLVCSIICLILIKTIDRSKVGKVTMIYTFLHLSLIHIYRMIVDYGGWTLDISTLFMMAFCKFTSFAYCYSDWMMPEEKLNKYTIKNKIKEFTILEYLSYIYFYPTCVMGPFFEFSDFIDFIKLKKDYQKIPKFLALKTGMKRLGQGLIFAGFYIILKPYSSIEFYFENMGGKYFPNIFVFFLFNIQKFKYNTGFLFSESVCVVSGLSYQINKDSFDFDKIKSVNLEVTEFTLHMSKFFQNWNITVHHWLKKYVFFRVYDNNEDYKDRKKLIYAKFVTFIVSGIWHGFYPSYYVIFFHFSLGMLVDDNFDYIKKNISNSKNFDLFLEYFYLFVMSFCAPYQIAILDALKISTMIRFMSSVYYFPTISALILAIWSSLYIKNNKGKVEKKD